MIPGISLIAWIKALLALLVPKPDAPIPAPGSTPLAGIGVALAEAAHECRINAGVIEAIERLETGNYTSVLWRGDKDTPAPWNPGGMLYHPELPELGHTIPPYIGKKSGIRYARFASPVAGIRGHGKFFLRPIYAAARAASDPEEQIRLIARAGYSEDPAWTNKVLKIYRTLTQPTVGSRIRKAALDLLRYEPRQFPYAPLTEGGRYGCAQVVSTALVAAGVLTEKEVQLAVTALSNVLTGKGWSGVIQPYFDGDVPVWGPSGENKHHHVGIIVIIDGIVSVIANSSEERRPKQYALADFDDRPLVHVLRAPGV